MKKKISLVLIVLILLVGSFFAGLHIGQHDVAEKDALTEFLLTENLAKAVMKADRIDRIREGKYEEVIDTLNHEIDSSLFVIAVLLDNETPEEARLDAYRLLMRVAEQRDEHPHRSARPDFQNRIDTLLTEAEARIRERGANSGER